MSEKRPRKAPKCPKICAMCTNLPKPSTGRILGYVAQNLIPRAPSSPTTPHFLWFPSCRIAQRDASTPVLVVTWWSWRAARPAHGGGQRWVHQGPRGDFNGPFQDQKWVNNGSKMCFSKSDRGPYGMLKQLFLAHVEPVVMWFGPWKIPKWLENGPFWDQKWVNNGSKMRFSKSDPGPFGMLKPVFLAHFESVVACSGPWKIPKCLGKGSFWHQQWVKNGSKTHHSKSDPRLFRMLKQVFLAYAASAGWLAPSCGRPPLPQPPQEPPPRAASPNAAGGAALVGPGCPPARVSLYPPRRLVAGGDPSEESARHRKKID